MTNREMLELKLRGRTYQEIGDMCGLTRQAIHLRIKNMLKSKIGEVVYVGIYDYMISAGETTFGGFSKLVNQKEKIISSTMLTRFLKGETGKVPIKVIARICEIVGKPFEEVFALQNDIGGGDTNA